MSVGVTQAFNGRTVSSIAELIDQLSQTYHELLTLLHSKSTAFTEKYLRNFSDKLVGGQLYKGRHKMR